VSTNFTKQVLNLPQFDILTISTQTFGLIIILVLFYYSNINTGLLYFIKIKKVRSKKIRKANANILKAGPNLKTMKWTSDINYQFYLQSKFL
jgi:hypothetical protein